jgi:hypothetical protein
MIYADGALVAVHTTASQGPAGTDDHHVRPLRNVANQDGF